MKSFHTRWSVPVFVFAVVGIATAVNAGSLTPPAGPIAPTMKNLSDVEPRTAIRNDFVSIVPIVISFPGSYYLAEDILALGSEPAIEIASNNVTLDLNGFTLYGNLEVGSPFGVEVSGSRTNIAIHNGTIRDFTSYGIVASNAANCRFEHLQLFNNGADGLNAGAGASVSHCVARSNQGSGIVVGQGSLISDCTATLNDGIGFILGSSTITSCTASQNGLHGISAVTSLVSNCTARFNGSSGITAGEGQVRGCMVRGNQLYGITGSAALIIENQCVANGFGIGTTGPDNRIEGNNVSNSTIGIDVDDASNLIIRNSVSNNTTGYSIVGGNTFGPIVNAAGIAASTNPHANYDY